VNTSIRYQTANSTWSVTKLHVSSVVILLLKLCYMYFIYFGFAKSYDFLEIFHHQCLLYLNRDWHVAVSQTLIVSSNPTANIIRNIM